MAMDGIFERDEKCPVCAVKFKVRMVKPSHVKPTTRDTDFCQNYEGLNPLYYDVWVCPECLYAAKRKEFLDVKPVAKKKLQETLLSNKGQHKEFNFHDYRDVNAAIASFELAVPCYELKDASDEVLAGLYLRAGWLCREVKDDDREKYYLRKAITHYLHFFEWKSESGSKLGEVGIMYILGELYRRTGEYREAVRWFGRVVIHDDIKRSPEIERLTRAAWQESRQKEREMLAEEAAQQAGQQQG